MANNNKFLLYINLSTFEFNFEGSGMNKYEGKEQVYFYKTSTPLDKKTLIQFIETILVKGPSEVASWFQDYNLIILSKKTRQVKLFSGWSGLFRIYLTRNSEELVVSNQLIKIKNKLSCVLNQEATFELLTTNHISLPYTLLKDVFVLPPAGFVSNAVENIKPRKYESLVKKDSVDISMRESQAVKLLEENLETLFNEMSKEHTNPPAVLLSGGIDSLAMLAYLKNYSAPLKTITFYVKGEENHPDFVAANKVAAYFKTDHFNIGFDENNSLEDYYFSLQNGDTPLYAGLLYQKLANQISQHEIYSGQDTRLHTPPYSKELELAIKNAFLKISVLPKLKIYQIYNEVMAIMTRPLGFQAFEYAKKQINSDSLGIVKLLLAYQPTSFSDEILNFEWIQSYFKDLLEAKNIDEFFRINVKFNYYKGYMDNVNEMSSVLNINNNCRFPFYVKQHVQFVEQIPYSISNQYKFTLNSHHFIPFVNKMLLRKALYHHIPKEFLFRRKEASIRLQNIIGKELFNELLTRAFNLPVESFATSAFLLAEMNAIKSKLLKKEFVEFTTSDFQKLFELSYLYELTK